MRSVLSRLLRTIRGFYYMAVIEPFDPNDPKERALLENKSGVPHEPPAVLRLQRQGYRGEALKKVSLMKPTVLVNALQKALDAEGDAHRRGCPIHDATVPKGTV